MIEKSYAPFAHARYQNAQPAFNMIVLFVHVYRFQSQCARSDIAAQRQCTVWHSVVQIVHSPHPHRPSDHPSRHRSFHRAQSNSSFPSLTFTALCARHIHRPKSSWLFSLGSLPDVDIHDRKSSAHTQHGYSSEKSCRNLSVLA